jgi:hypothetical protein
MINYSTNKEFVEQLSYPKEPIVATIEIKVNTCNQRDIKYAIQTKYPHLESFKHSVVTSLRELGLLIHLVMLEDDTSHIDKIVDYYDFNFTNPKKYKKKIKLNLTDKDLKYLKTVQDILLLNTKDTRYLLTENAFQFIIYYAWKTLVANDLNIQDCVKHIFK